MKKQNDIKKINKKKTQKTIKKNKKYYIKTHIKHIYNI